MSVQIKYNNNEYAIDYKCDCSIDRVERALISLGKLELRNIIDEGKDESIICDPRPPA